MNHPGKRSKWYPLSKKPDMPGWYEFRWMVGAEVLIREFDGHSWKIYWYEFRGLNAEWRGLAEEPK